MHFYEVPKLGSYLAVKLQYKSCLFVEALEAAVLDFKDVEQRRQAQIIEKEKWNEEQDARRKEFEEARAREAAEKAALATIETEREGEEKKEEGPQEVEAEPEFEEEAKEWEKITLAPYKSKKVQYCVCMHTMGQDRKYTEK